VNATKKLIVWLAFIIARFLSASALLYSTSGNCIWENISTKYDAATGQVSIGYGSLGTSSPAYNEAKMHPTTGETKSLDTAFSLANLQKFLPQREKG